MSVAGGGFDQAYNAQAAVAAGSMLVICRDVVQAPNDKQQIEPVLGQLTGLPESLGKAETLLADSGYFSQANVEACAETQITPLIAPGRERHNRSWKDRFAAAPPEPDDRRRCRRCSIGWRRRKAASSMRCASRRLSPCSESSSRSWAFDNSTCAASNR